MAEKTIAVIIKAVIEEAERKLKRFAKSTESSMKDMQRSTADLPAPLQDVADRMDELQARAEETRERLHEVADSADDMGESFDLAAIAAEELTTAAALMGVAFGVALAAERVVRLAEEAAMAQRVAASYDHLASRAQVDSSLMLEALKEASRGTISEYDLMLEANKAWYLGTAQTVGQYSDLMKIAEVKSKDLAMTTLEYWQRLNAAIASGYPLGLQQLGIMVDMEVAYEDYARSIGKTADELTEQEEMQARVNAVINDGADALGRWETGSYDAATATQEFRAAIQDLRDSIAEGLLPVFIPAMEWITKGLRGVEAGIDGQNAVIAELIETTGSAAAAEEAFAESIMIASQGMIDGALAAQLAHRAMVDYRLDLIGIDKGIREDIRAMQMAEKATLDWGDALNKSKKDLSDMKDEARKAADIMGDYYRRVAEENWNFARRTEDAQFRATQAAEDAAFRLHEIQREADQRRDDLWRSYRHEQEMDQLRHQQDVRRMWQDHYDNLVDIEYDYQQDRANLLRRAPWWVRQALEKEFKERERIAASGDKEALKNFDKTLQERIKLVDPVYAEELDLLDERYDHEEKIEDREHEQRLDRANETYRTQLRDQEWRMREQLRQLERDLRDQIRAWDFHNRQRLENERWAMDRLVQEHNHRLANLKADVDRRLAELSNTYKHYGYVHRMKYAQGWNDADRDFPISAPIVGGIHDRPDYGAYVGPYPFPEQPFAFQRGAWEIPRNMLGSLDKGEMVIPAAPAERIRQGGLGTTIIIENLHLGAGVNPGMGYAFANEMFNELGARMGRRAA